LVEKYKYLGLLIDFKLNWGEHVNILIKRLNQRLSGKTPFLQFR